MQIKKNSEKYLGLALFTAFVTGAYFIVDLIPTRGVTEEECIQSRTAIMRSINDYRQENGLSSLEENPLLTAAAQSRAIYGPDRDASYSLNNMGINDVAGIVSATLTNYSNPANREMNQLKSDSNESLLNSQLGEMGSGASLNDKGCYQVLFLR